MEARRIRPLRRRSKPYPQHKQPLRNTRQREASRLIKTGWVGHEKKENGGTLRRSQQSGKEERRCWDIVDHKEEHALCGPARKTEASGREKKKGRLQSGGGKTCRTTRKTKGSSDKGPLRGHKDLIREEEQAPPEVLGDDKCLCWVPEET